MKTEESGGWGWEGVENGGEKRKQNNSQATYTDSLLDIQTRRQEMDSRSRKGNAHTLRWGGSMHCK